MTEGRIGISGIFLGGGDNSPIYQHITAIHQQVRDFISQYLIDNDLPYLVAAIEGKSNYAPTLKTRDDLIPQYVLTEIDETYCVTALSPHSFRRRGMCFDVCIDSDGKFRIVQQSIIA